MAEDVNRSFLVYHDLFGNIVFLYEQPYLTDLTDKFTITSLPYQ